MRAFVAVLVAALAASCATSQPEAPKAAQAAPTVDGAALIRAQRSLEVLSYYLEGSWRTMLQPANEGDNTPMLLRIARVWPERQGEIWLYWENTDPQDGRHVHRQRLVRYFLQGERLFADNYRLPGDPTAFLGEWRKEHPFAGVDPARLVQYPGCREEWFRQVELAFAGATLGTDCRGDFAAGLHEHAEFFMSSDGLRAWVSLKDSAGNLAGGPGNPTELRKFSRKLQ